VGSVTRWSRLLREVSSISIGVLFACSIYEGKQWAIACFSSLLAIHLLQRLWLEESP